MKVMDIMNGNAAVCRESDSLNDAAKVMWDRDIGCLPVIDDAGRAIGMITDRDVCMAAYTRGSSLDALHVGGAMARGAMCCAPDDSVEQVEAKMREHQIRRLPVVDSDGVTGLISLNDIARAAASSDKRLNGVSLDEVGMTLAKICQPSASPSG